MTQVKIFPIKGDPQVYPLDYTVRRYKNSHAPEEFQRPESWGKEERKSYFQSILMNRIGGDFVLVDIQLAIDKLEKLNTTDRAYGFFMQFFRENFKYIILDGNNRLKFLTALMSDEYQIPRGTYKYVIEGDIKTLVVGGKDNNVFSKLPTLVQKAINDRKLVASEYFQIDYTGLSDVFIGVNSGVFLNNQEKRNAMDSEWSDWVRQLRKEIASLLITMFGSNYKSRLKCDEWIVQCLNFVIDCTPDNIEGVTQGTMNRLYGSKIEGIDQESLLENFVKLDEYIHKMISDDEFEFDGNEEKVKVLSRGSTVINLFWMMNNGINTYEQACAAVIAHEKIYKNPSSLINDDGNNYVWACGGLGAKNNEMKMQILPQIVEKLNYSVVE